jgi:hypothetical protein
MFSGPGKTTDFPSSLISKTFALSCQATLQCFHCLRWPGGFFSRTPPWPPHKSIWLISSSPGEVHCFRCLRFLSGENIFRGEYSEFLLNSILLLPGWPQPGLLFPLLPGHRGSSASGAAVRRPVHIPGEYRWEYSNRQSRFPRCCPGT